MERRPLPRPLAATGQRPAERMPNILRKPQPPIVAILLDLPRSFVTHYHHDPAVGKRISRGCYGDGCPRCQLAKPHNQHYAPVLVYRSRGGIAAAKRSPLESWDREILAVPHYSLGKFTNDRSLGLIVEVSTHRDQLSIGLDPAGGPHAPAFPVPAPFDLELALTRFLFPEEWEASLLPAAPAPDQPAVVVPPAARAEGRG